MIGQRIVIIALALLTPLWGYGIYTQFAAEDEAPPSKTAKAKNNPAKKTGQGSLNPKMKRTLPNLHQGYLFNNERFLKSSGAQATANTASSPNINMDTLQYDGSVIVGESRKAIVSYATGGVAKPAKKTKKSSSRRRQQKQANRDSKIIALGETIGGYTVSQIEPSRIVFSRGSNNITKELFATEKQRQAAPRVKRQAAPSVKQKKPTPSRIKKSVKKTRPEPPPPRPMQDQPWPRNLQ